MPTPPQEMRSRYQADGYLIVRGMFNLAEVARLRRRYEDITAGPDIKGHWEPQRGHADPLKQFPRIVHPHRFDALSKQYLLHRGVQNVLRALFDDEPIAVQSMYYFKPPGAKGQALHQDDFYLSTRPSPCIAAWTAIDPSHPENGGLYVVPGTHTMNVVCPELSEESESFTTHFVKPPAGKEAVPAILEPGDTLFFNGSVIHGSKPNRTASTWRRSFICHYIASKSSHVSKWFQPAIDFDENAVPFGESEHGGPCGFEFQAFWDGLSQEQKRELATRV